MPQRSTDNDFDRMTWHDNTLYGLRFDIGDTQRGQWHSNLVLDLDHLVEWVRDADGDMRFRVVPATLVFHDVADLRIDVAFADSACRTAINEPSIDGLTRRPVSDQKICLDRAYYRWRTAFNWPRGGEIAFGASGFTQTWRAEPRLLDQQRRGRFDAI